MIAVPLLVAAALVGATTRIDIAPWLGLLIGGGFGSIAAGWVVLRRAKTDREDTRANTAQTLTNATEKWSEYVDEKLDEVLAENKKLRDDNLAKRAEIAAAHASTAAAEAATARAEAERSSERHDLQQEITARETRIALLEAQVGELRAEVSALRARIDPPSRRVTDSP